MLKVHLPWCVYCLPLIPIVSECIHKPDQHAKFSVLGTWSKHKQEYVHKNWIRGPVKSILGHVNLHSMSFDLHESFWSNGPTFD